MNKKMIVVDLDGTLLNINQGCSKKTKRYLKRLKELGHIVVIATGRILKDAIEITDGALFANYVIASAGGVIYDMDNRKILKKNNISIDDVRMICSYNNEDIRHIEMGDLFYYHKYVNEGIFKNKFSKMIDNIDEFLNNCDDIFHITFKLKDMNKLDEYYKKFDNDSLSILIMQDSFKDERYLEIFKEGVSKYNGIKYIMDILNIDNKNVITFGDGLNDVDMIKNSGIGVAMGNALMEVKNVSDYTTISHNEDGVIYFLRGYLDKDNLIS